MKLYPAIDLHEGKAVRLYKGDYDQVTTYGDPVTQAKKFKEEGATFLHVVDLDGAKDGSFKNLEALKRIITEAKIDCELGGGIRSISQIDTLLNIGVKRVILGSSALNLDFVKEAVDKIALTASKFLNPPSLAPSKSTKCRNVAPRLCHLRA